MNKLNSSNKVKEGKKEEQYKNKMKSNETNNMDKIRGGILHKITMGTIDNDMVKDINKAKEDIIKRGRIPKVMMRFEKTRAWVTIREWQPNPFKEK